MTRLNGAAAVPRNERILNAWWRGDTPKAIAARENLSPAGVRKIAHIARLAGDERAFKRRRARVRSVEA